METVTIIAFIIFGLIDVYYFNTALDQLIPPWSYKEIWWWIVPGGGIVAYIKLRNKETWI